MQPLYCELIIIDSKIYIKIVLNLLEFCLEAFTLFKRSIQMVNYKLAAHITSVTCCYLS